MNRAEMLSRARERTTPWDIIVIGGGATGAGCAVDAASRGLDVLLVEQSDFGKGTSSRSTKLVHGGVRYLAQGDIPLVREAMKERGLLLRNAPHHVGRQEFVVPCRSRWQKFYYGTGLKIYDALAGSLSFGRSRLLSREETLARLPSLRPEGLAGGVLYYDGQFDDTRLLIDLITTAHAHGAVPVNYAKVDRIDKSAGGRTSGVGFEDVLSGESFTAEARVVINATGVFCDEVRNLSDGSAAGLVTPSQGIHVVLSGRFLPTASALMIPRTPDGRVLFCIPWHGHTLIGTTDTPVAETPLEPVPREAEIDFILETAGAFLTSPPTREDVLSTFAGIRPLVRSSARKQTSALSRGHTIVADDPGMITVTGGKWTTYRRMAEDAVDVAVETGDLSAGSCRTENLGIAFEAGSNAGERLHPDLRCSRDDVVRAVRVEMAQTLEDVLARRTRGLFLNAKASIELAPLVAPIMAAQLGLGEEWIEQQIKDFTAIARNYLMPH